MWSCSRQARSVFPGTRAVRKISQRRIDELNSFNSANKCAYSTTAGSSRSLHASDSPKPPKKLRIPLEHIGLGPNNLTARSSPASEPKLWSGNISVQATTKPGFSTTSVIEPLMDVLNSDEPPVPSSRPTSWSSIVSNASSPSLPSMDVTAPVEDCLPTANLDLHHTPDSGFSSPQTAGINHMHHDLNSYAYPAPPIESRLHRIPGYHSTYCGSPTRPVKKDTGVAHNGVTTKSSEISSPRRFESAATVDDPSAEALVKPRSCTASILAPLLDALHGDELLGSTVQPTSPAPTVPPSPAMSKSSTASAPPIVERRAAIWHLHHSPDSAPSIIRVDNIDDSASDWGYFVFDTPYTEPDLDLLPGHRPVPCDLTNHHLPDSGIYLDYPAPTTIQDLLSTCFDPDTPAHYAQHLLNQVLKYADFRQWPLTDVDWLLYTLSTGSPIFRCTRQTRRGIERALLNLAQLGGQYAHKGYGKRLHLYAADLHALYPDLFRASFVTKMLYTLLNTGQYMAALRFYRMFMELFPPQYTPEWRRLVTLRLLRAGADRLARKADELAERPTLEDLLDMPEVAADQPRLRQEPDPSSRRSSDSRGSGSTAKSRGLSQATESATVDPLLLLSRLSTQVPKPTASSKAIYMATRLPRILRDFSLSQSTVAEAYTHVVQLCTRIHRLRPAMVLLRAATQDDRVSAETRTVLANMIIQESFRPRRGTKNARAIRYGLHIVEQLPIQADVQLDRVTLNIILRALGTWMAGANAAFMRTVWDELTRMGYPPGPAGVAPFGTPKSVTGSILRRFEGRIEMRRHVRPLYGVFLREFGARGDAWAVRVVRGALAESEGRI